VSKKPSIPVTLAPRKLPVVYAFQCGCIAENVRSNRVQQFDGTSCEYSPTKPLGATTRTAHRRR
jgi:hypothetical protein